MVTVVRVLTAYIIGGGGSDWSGNNSCGSSSFSDGVTKSCPMWGGVKGGNFLYPIWFIPKPTPFYELGKLLSSWIGYNMQTT